MTKKDEINIVRVPVTESKSAKKLFVSMDPESFDRSTGPTAEEYRKALLEADAALHDTKPYVPVRRGDAARRRRRR